MKISIITVCRNSESTIEDTIKSVLEQSYSNIEYIIIDGKSTDKTLEIIEKYKDKINYFISENDTGIYNAMNKAVKVATGDVLFFLNSNDTFFDENTVQNVADEFLKTNADILYGDILLINEDKRNSFIRSYSALNKMYIFYMGFYQQAIFIKASTFNKNGLFDESYVINGDGDWILKALFKNNIKSKYINQTIAKFTLGGISNNKKFDKIHQEERTKLLELYYTTFELKFHKILMKHFRSLTRIDFLMFFINKILKWNPS